MFYRVGRKEWGMQSFAVYGNGLTDKIGLRDSGTFEEDYCYSPHQLSKAKK
jgi:hypothetical protein